MADDDVSLEDLIAIERVARTLWEQSTKGTIMEWEALPALAEAGVAQPRRDRGHHLAQIGRFAITAAETAGAVARPGQPRYRRLITILIEIFIDTMYRQRKPCMSVHASSPSSAGWAHPARRAHFQRLSRRRLGEPRAMPKVVICRLDTKINIGSSRDYD